MTPETVIEASACAKLILCGEHSVVYGRPAIAIPVSGRRAWATITPRPPQHGLLLELPDLDERFSIAEADRQPLAALAVHTLTRFGAVEPFDFSITISSEIPIASGMGSGAAVATALVRAIAAHLGEQLSTAELSAMVYESERGYHGTPSGIDNTVIAHEQPIWFVREATESAGFCSRLEPIAIAQPLVLLIGDSGIRSATRLPVGAVREQHQANPSRYEALFDHMGNLVTAARKALEEGNPQTLGSLLNQNHELLRAIGVSSPELDRLVAAAQDGGALGAKLSGAGWGGAMLALVEPEAEKTVREALHAAGAVHVFHTELAATTPAHTTVTASLTT